MGILSVLLLSVFGISAILLVVIILMQDEQSDGLGGIFGGGSSNQVGNRQGNILTKTTTVLGVIFLLVAFAVAWLNHLDTGGIIKAATTPTKTEQAKATDWWSTDSTTKPAASSQNLDASLLEATPAASAAPQGSAKPAASTAPQSSAKPVASTAPAAVASPVPTKKP